MAIIAPSPRTRRSPGVFRLSPAIRLSAYAQVVGFLQQIFLLEYL